METQGWGDSMVTTKYVYQRIHHIMDMENRDEMDYHLSRFMDELANNYFVDTDSKIGEKL